MREYYTNRPQIAIGEPGKSRNNAGAALEIPGADGIGLHPNLTGILESPRTPPITTSRFIFV